MRRTSSVQNRQSRLVMLTMFPLTGLAMAKAACVMRSAFCSVT
jgi:hypothetical protein